MADDTPSTTTTTTTPLLRPSRRWFNSLRLKTTLSAEVRGSMGDLGTYIPIILTLTLVNHLDLSTTLIFTALYNIPTGFLFSIPMPVQPMKSIVAVAISDPLLSLSQIAAASLSTAATLFIFGATGLMSLLYRFIPLPVVCGVQLSQGLAFAFSAIKYIRYNQDFSSGKSGPPRNWLGLDGIALALFSILFLVLVTGSGDFGDEEIPLGVHEEENDSVICSCSHVRRRLRIMSSIPDKLTEEENRCYCTKAFCTEAEETK